MLRPYSEKISHDKRLMVVKNNDKYRFDENQWRRLAVSEANPNIKSKIARWGSRCSPQPAIFAENGKISHDEALFARKFPKISA